MITFRLLSSPQVQVYFVLFVGFALAGFQNVTVDDSVLTGAVVPQYLPSDNVWNQGNNCTACFVKPDPTQAYNGTWHDSTYSSSNGYTQAIEFTFTGSALYIFFIIANNVTGATTLTDVDFVLDQVPVSTYIHEPTASTDYQYNVPVYANESLVPGEHNMLIQPVNSGNHVLILFDYLIYTINTSSPVTSVTTGSVSPSPTSSNNTTSSVQHAVTIAGGTVGGIAALAVVATSMLCCWRRKRRKDSQSMPGEGAVEPFIFSREAAVTPSAGTTVFPVTSFKSGLSFPRPETLSAVPTAALPSSGAASSSDNSALLEQVELLRGEVARLRDLQDSSRQSAIPRAEAPPEYS